MSEPNTTRLRNKAEKSTSKVSQIGLFILYNLLSIIRSLFHFTLIVFRLKPIRNWLFAHGPNSPTPRIHHEETEKLARIWATEGKSTIVFVTLEIGLQPEDPKKICDIGVSLWCPGGILAARSYHMIIKSNNPDSEILGEFDDSFEGITGHIQEFEIGEFLNETFRTATSGYSKVYLAGYGIDKTMKALSPYWQASVGVQLIDIQMILRARHKDQEPIIFEERVSMVASLAGKVGSFNAAGNRAFASMVVLQNEGAQQF